MEGATGLLKPGLTSKSADILSFRKLLSIFSINERSALLQVFQYEGIRDPDSKPAVFKSYPFGILKPGVEVGSVDLYLDNAQNSSRFLD